MKRASIIFCLFVFLTPISSSALGIYEYKEFSIDLSGYYKNLFGYTDFNLEIPFFDLGYKYLLDDYNRLRLKAAVNLTDDLALLSHYEIRLIYGDSQGLKSKVGEIGEFSNNLTNLFGLTGLKPERLLNLDWEIEDSKTLYAEHGFDRLLFSYHLPFADLTIGRQAFSWGTGIIWNPTDLFAPFSPTEIDTEEKTGTDIINLEIPIGSLTGLNAIYAPLETFEDSSIAGRFKTNIYTYDLSIMMGKFHEEMVYGLDFSGYIGGAGFRGEGTYTQLEEEEDFLRFILGADYSFPRNFYLSLEYYYNGFGTTNENRYLSLFLSDEFLKRISRGEIYNLARDYLGAFFSYPIFPLLTLRGTIIFNLDDQSIFLSPALEYSILTGLDFMIGANIFKGKDGSEYGLIKGDYLGIPIEFGYPQLYFSYLKWYF
jgi:hypothetical protein